MGDMGLPCTPGSLPLSLLVNWSLDFSLDTDLVLPSSLDGGLDDDLLPGLGILLNPGVGIPELAEDDPPRLIVLPAEELALLFVFPDRFALLMPAILVTPFFV